MRSRSSRFWPSNATYDLTNQAVLRGFPTLVAVVDLAWGATISAAVATIGYWAAAWLGVA